MSTNEKIAVIPNLGDYYYPVKILIERCLNIKLVKCPPSTKKTVELGAKNSPDTICTPYKITLGNFIEAIQAAKANVLIMPGIACRLGLYDVLQKQALLDMGYELEMLVLFDFVANSSRLYRNLSAFSPELTEEAYKAILDIVVRIVLDMDELADFMRRNIAFEIRKGEFEAAYNAYLNEAINVEDAEAARILGDKYRGILGNINIDKPKNPIRIGLVGDLYSVIEPHGNCHIEKWLSTQSVEIIRPFNLTYMVKSLLGATGLNELLQKSGGYSDYNLGGVANCTVALALELATFGVDGLIHMKAASCSPEITAMSILQNISADKDVPIIYLTFDTETSEAGLHTRLEAFLDMHGMKRRKK